MFYLKRVCFLLFGFVFLTACSNPIDIENFSAPSDEIVQEKTSPSPEIAPSTPTSDCPEISIPLLPSSSPYAWRDFGYKLFWGEWEITKIIGENSRYGAVEGAEDLIGAKLKYSYHEIRLNGVLTCEKPVYNFTIVPMNPTPIFKYMPSQEEIGLTGSFFIFVRLMSEWDQQLEYPLASSFFIKDDNTLIIYENDAFYEAVRLSYDPEAYEAIF